MNYGCIVRIGYRRYVYSWVNGLKLISPTPRIMTEEDVLARALWLERNEREDDALDLLEEYIELRMKREVTWQCHHNQTVW